MRPEWEINQLTSRTVHALLKESIKGGVNVRVEDDDLVVKIISYDFEFNYVKPKWIDYIFKGGDINYVVYDIVHNFRKAIIAKYMY